MKIYRSIVFILIFFSLYGCASHPIVPEGNVNIDVWQNGALVEQIGNTVTLNKNRFEIKLKFTETMQVLVHAYSDSTSYDQAKKELSINNIDGFYHTGMAESLRNENLNIQLSKRSSGMWFYNDREKNRCDKTETKSRQTICTRTVENIFFVDDKHRQKIEKYIHENIYLVFISYVYDRKLGQTIELDRDILKLSFRE